MNLIMNSIATVFLFYIGINSVSSLKCHVCNTINPGQEDCETITPEDMKYLQNCSESHSASCRTQEQWVDFEVLKQKHDKRVIRQCASTEFEPNRPCYYRTGFGGRVNVCNCLGDGCNEAAKTASTLLMTVGLFLLVKLFI